MIRLEPIRGLYSALFALVEHYCKPQRHFDWEVGLKRAIVALRHTHLLSSSSMEACAALSISLAAPMIKLTPMHFKVLLSVSREKYGTMVTPSSSAKNSSCKRHDAGLVSKDQFSK